MSVTEPALSRAPSASSAPRLTSTFAHWARTRTYALVAVAFVVIVITVSSLATSGTSPALKRAQDHYLSAITPVEQAELVFNGSSSTAANHSTASTRALVFALKDEFIELDDVKWPDDVARDVRSLANDTQSEIQLFAAYDAATGSKRAAILGEQSTVENAEANVNESILKALKLPLPTSASAPASSSPLAP